MKNRLIFLCFLMSALTNANAAQIYTWTDENGKKHFSQTPPVNQQNIKYEEKTIKTSKPAHSQKETRKGITEKYDNSNNNKDILRHGEVGPADVLIKKRNPDKLYLVFTPNVNIIIKKEEQKKGRKLTPQEIERIRSKATAKAVKHDEIKNYK